jgi:hypothetical protein
MRDLIWLIVVILIIGWLIGYFGFGEAVGNLIHILLVLAIIGILYRLATGRRLETKNLYFSVFLKHEFIY